jgi:hypothetical protein
MKILYYNSYLFILIDVLYQKNEYKKIINQLKIVLNMD